MKKCQFWRKVRPYALNTVYIIITQVWNYNLIRDEFMGMVRILGISGKSTKEGVQQLNLLGRKKENNVMKPGRLSIELKTFPDLTHA